MPPLTELGSRPEMVGSDTNTTLSLGIKPSPVDRGATENTRMGVPTRGVRPRLTLLTPPLTTTMPDRVSHKPLPSPRPGRAHIRSTDRRIPPARHHTPLISS